MCCLTEACYISSIGFFLLKRCSFSPRRCPFHTLNGHRIHSGWWLVVGVLAPLKNVISTWRVLSFSKTVSHAGKKSYPTEGVPEFPPWHAEPCTAKVLEECSHQAGRCHRHPRGTSVRGCLGGKLASRILCAVRVALDTRQSWLS